MTPHRRDVDPKSFRGKFYLLVIDKLVISAVIALALAMYDIWKTEDSRRYDEARQETDLAFRRAEYVQNLVPIVLDPATGVLVRSEVLSALVDTESISPESAVGFAQQLLLSDLLGTRRYHRRYVSSAREGDVLLSTVLKVMPAALPSVLNEFDHVANRHQVGRKTNPRDKEMRILNDAMGFWIDVFRKTVEQFDDGELLFLDSEPFLSQNFATIVAIVPTLSPADAARWMEREVKAVKTIGALQLVQDQSEHPIATEYLRTAVNPKSGAGVGTEVIDFASGVIRQLRRSDVMSLELSAEILNIVLKRENRSLHKRHSVEHERNPARDHFFEAAEYLRRLGSVPKVVEALESRVIAELQKFYQTIDTASLESLEYRSYPIELALVGFLAKSSSSSSQKLSAETQRTLSDLFAIGDDKLQSIGLLYQANCWKGTERCRVR